jgi:hypothetical protein
MRLGHKSLSVQEDQAADTNRLQPTISTHCIVATTGNLIQLVLVLVPLLLMLSQS